jgi:hypothetical protein
MHAEVILLEVRNPETQLWEYFEYNNFISSNVAFDIQRDINRKLKICHCDIFDCCGSYFHELFIAIEREHSAPSFFKGLPKDVSEEIASSHNIWFEDIEMGYDASYLSLNDLIAFDYNQTIEEKSGWEEISGVHCTKSWSRVLKTYHDTEHTFRNALGEKFFIDLDFLKTIGKPDEVRIVYWFWDNSNADADMDDILNNWTC